MVMDKQPIDINYLNEISAPVKSGGVTKKQKLILLIAGAALALIVLAVVMIVFSISAGQKTDTVTSAYLRLSNLQASARNLQKNVSDSSLRAINAEFNTQLTNSVRDFGVKMEEAGIELDKISTKVEEDETAHIDTFNNAMENARLNGIFDRMYATNVLYELNLLIPLIDQAVTNTNNSGLKEILATIRSETVTLQERFTSFNSTSD